MNAMTLKSLIVPGALAALFLAACGDDPPPPLPPRPAVEKKAAGVQNLPDPTAELGLDGGSAAAAAPPPAYVYAYDPVGKRDPFRSPFVERGGPTPPITEACSGPLAKWELSQLKLVATVTSDASPMGMLEDPEGKGHVVRRNSLVGRMCGKVTEVLRECVTVTEYYPAPDGKRIPSPKRMCVSADIRGAPVQDLGSGKDF